LVSWSVAGLELCLAVLAHLFMTLSLLALDNDMSPLWLGRGHSNEYGACGGSCWVIRGTS